MTLLLELTEIDVEIEDKVLQTADILGDQLLSSSIPQILASILQKLDQRREEELDTGYQILGIYENLFELKPKSAALGGEKTGLALWLLQQLCPENGILDLKESFSKMTLYSSEILSIILQEPSVQSLFVTEPAIQAFVRTIRTLQGEKLLDMEMKETLLNLFNCLSLVLLNPEARELFADNEGIEVMLKLIK